MTVSDRLFVAGCFAAMTVILGAIQVAEGGATRSAIREGSSDITFPSSMDVVVKNDSPIPVELNAQTVASNVVGVPSSEVPIPVKIVRDYGSYP